MGMLSRLTTLIRAKMSQMRNVAETPSVGVDYAYPEERELPHHVKGALAAVVTSRRHLELQAEKVREGINQLDQQASQALQDGREDLARLSLRRKQAMLQHLQGLDARIAELEVEQQKLQSAEMRLAAKVEAFRIHKDVIRAQYPAAEARVRMGEAAAGFAEELAAMGFAIERAEQKIAQMREGVPAVLEGPGEDGEQSVGRERSQLAAAESVEAELEALKRQLAPPEARPRGGNRP